MSDPSPNPESVFAQMIEIDSPEQRAALLDQACGNDPELRREMEKLVSDHFRAGQFLESPAAHCLATIEQPSAERPGTMIGPYKLMEQIGEGGMGLVFVAEQRQPVRRKVALKIIKPGMDSRQVIARFEAERQALAMMDHPNIAKVHDGGTTPTGRPYFVMELVRGVPITQYCDDNRLKPRERLELFSHVCAAVQHAHQKGIIHRDIKPSNVLVVSHDGTPVVKVIDFGVAKAMGQQLTDKTIYTDFLQFIGTPLYMSPEQAGQSGLDVDTRTDVYALGVLLYELLTGTTPFDKDRLHKAGYDEIRRLIREEEPPKPSTRISTIGQAGTTVYAQRQSDSKQLCKMLRGELDWIVMKALEKDRNRRYESASALAADVQRYLQDEQVEACPPSALYRLRKFTRRHRARLGVAALLGVTVLLGGVAFIWQQGQRASIAQAVDNDWNEADRYWKEKSWAKALPALERASGRLVGSGLTSLQTKVENRRREAALIAALDNASLQTTYPSDVERDFAGADRFYTAAFAEFGLDPTALPPEEAARRIRDSEFRVQMVTALDNWSYVRERMADHRVPVNGESLRAIAQLADDDEWRRDLRDPKVINDPAALIRMAQSSAVKKQLPEYLMILFHRLEGATGRSGRRMGSKHPAVQMLLNMQPTYPQDYWINSNLGYHLADEPESAADAIGYNRAALAVYPLFWMVHESIALAFERRGNLPAVEATYRNYIALSPESRWPHILFGSFLSEQRRFEQATAAFQKAIAIDPDFWEAHEQAGDHLGRQGKWPEAEVAYRKAIELTDHWSPRLSLGNALLQQGKFTEALASQKRGYELGSKSNKLGSQSNKWRDTFDEVIRQTEQIVLLDPKLPEILKNETMPADPAERLALGSLCQLPCRQFYAAAVRFFSQAFSAEPRLENDLQNDYRYNTARAAVLAGCGKGKDAGNLRADEYAVLRAQALAWLRADLAARRDEMHKDFDKRAHDTRRHLRHCQLDPDFNGVRRAEALVKLPQAERREWQQLWEEIADLLGQRPAASTTKRD